MRRAVLAVVVVLALAVAAGTLGAQSPVELPVARETAGASGASDEASRAARDGEAAAPDGAAVAAWFAQGVDAYRAGDFDEATALFARAAEAEPDAVRRALCHANAGTAAARGDELGEALWHLERARRLAPGDATVALNLAQVRALLGEGETAESHFTDTLLRLPLALTPDDTRTLVAVLLGAGLLAAALWRASGWPALGWSAVLLVVLPLLWWGWSARVHAVAGREAVVIPDTVAVRREPQDDGGILFRLGTGTVVSSEETRRGWRLVETAEAGRGWVPADAVRPLHGEG